MFGNGEGYLERKTNIRTDRNVTGLISFAAPMRGIQNKIPPSGGFLRGREGPMGRFGGSAPIGGRNSGGKREGGIKVRPYYLFVHSISRILNLLLLYCKLHVFHLKYLGEIWGYAIMLASV